MVRGIPGDFYTTAVALGDSVVLWVEWVKDLGAVLASQSSRCFSGSGMSMLGGASDSPNIHHIDSLPGNVLV